MRNLEWELIDKKEGSCCNEYRASVPGGWIVKLYHLDDDSEGSLAAVFIPDSNHSWKLEC